MTQTNSSDQLSLPLPVNRGRHFAVIVVGGGVSGCIAALAAARQGASTLLIEEHGFLGGSLTSMGVGPMMSFHNGVGEPMVKGLPQELIDRLQARGASPGHIPDTTTYCSTVTPFDSEALKLELERMLEEAGACVLFHTQLAATHVESKQVRKITVCNKSGLTAYSADIVVDATGDGDLSAQAGATFSMGRESDHATQPMTMNLKVGNVDIEAVRAYVKAHPEDFLWKHGAELGLERLEKSPRVSLAGFTKDWALATERGEVDVPRDQVLFFETATPGVVIVNTSRIQGLNPTDPFDLSKAEYIGRQQCVQIFDFLKKYCAGFANALRMDTASKVGVREARHVQGLHTLTAEDLLSQRSFPDVIAMGGYPIDIHSPDDDVTRTTEQPRDLSYQIPLRSIISADIENLIVIGRCLAATHEASAAVRVTPIAMAIGQAGGVLAATAAADAAALAKVPPATVQSILRTQGALLPQ